MFITLFHYLYANNSFFIHISLNDKYSQLQIKMAQNIQVFLFLDKALAIFFSLKSESKQVSRIILSILVCLDGLNSSSGFQLS